MRHNQLYQLINLLKPKTIIEIGTWNGQNACNMLAACDTIEAYFGYDLFEEATDQTDKLEFNVKKHYSQQDVAELIHKYHPNTSVTLVKGNTRETLKPLVADFAFIDGGHSIETIRSDYEKLQFCNVVVFDDYYVPDENGKCPDLDAVGCNRVVEGIPHVVFGDCDPVKEGGYTRLVMVIK